MMKEELILRSYQDRIISGAREQMKKNKNIIIYAPQGSGKSVIAAFMAVNSAKNNLRVLVLSHRDEILKQNFRKIDMLGVKVQMISSVTQTILDHRIYCGMTQTIASRCRTNTTWIDWLATIDMVIVDEAHRGEHDVLYQYFRQNIWRIGLSASIMRYGGMKQLGMFYESVSKNVSTKELIALKFLTPAKHFAFQAPKVDDVGVNRATGDYIQRQLQEKFRSLERYAGIIENYQKICPGTQTIVFTTGAKHTVELCKAFNDAGISAKYLLTRRMPETDEFYSGKREDVINQFLNKDYQVLINISIVDTGFDAPIIESVILDYSTKSYTKFAQSIGRGSRLLEGKRFFNILDFGSNIDRFGFFEDEPPIALYHNTSGNGIAPTKECPREKPDINGKLGCGRLLHISATDCHWCGYHFSTDKEIYTVELREIIRNQKEDEMTIKEWVAHKVLQGWSINRIFCAVMTKNKDHMRNAFEEVRQVVRTEKGQMVSPDYYYFLKKHYLKKQKK